MPAGRLLFSCERLFLFSDDRALRRHFGVQGGEVFPLFRQVVFVEDCFDGAFRDAGFAVDALVGMDVENLFPFVKTFDGAHYNAVGVFACEAWFSNDVCHFRFAPFKAIDVCPTNNKSDSRGIRFLNHRRGSCQTKNESDEYFARIIRNGSVKCQPARISRLCRQGKSHRFSPKLEAGGSLFCADIESMYQEYLRERNWQVFPYDIAAMRHGRGLFLDGFRLASACRATYNRSM